MHIMDTFLIYSGIIIHLAHVLTHFHMKNHKYWVTSFLLLQQGFKPGLAERLNAWLASAENAESLQQQLDCCANTSSEQDFTTLCSLASNFSLPQPTDPSSPHADPTSPLPATTGPSSPPEPSCPPATPSCLSVLASRYHNLLVALLGAYLCDQKAWLHSKLKSGTDIAVSLAVVFCSNYFNNSMEWPSNTCSLIHNYPLSLSISTI